MGSTSARDRVMAALRGDRVDRIPVSFWAHNFAMENSANELSAETVRLASKFGWDYLKPQSRAQCFAEMWGLTYQPSGLCAVPHTVAAPFKSANDLRRLRPVDPSTGALGEQLDALALIRGRLGSEIPIIWTVFSSVAVLRYLFQGGEAQFLDILRTAPAALESALEAITETLAQYAGACIARGADGIFLATTIATRDKLSVEECRRFQRKYDMPILQAVQDAPFNVMHVCGERVLFDQFIDYSVAAFSWAAVPGNPSLTEGHRATGRAVIGGLPAKPVFKTMTETEVRERVRMAVTEMQGRWLLLGPGCSVDPDAPKSLLRAARDAAHQTGS
jgi:uroporphyrinogen decarboxylase